MSKLDIARALQDKEYFNSLSDEEQVQVRAEGALDQSQISDEDLESVSGGLEGGVSAEADTCDDDCCCCCCCCPCCCEDGTELQ